MKNEARIGGIVVGGQPERHELLDGRFDVVVNLRLADEDGNTTARDVAGTAVGYVEEPLTSGTLSADHVERIMAALDRATGDVLIH